ncbi:hypothetical protein EDD85DRAFT_958100 [Armillaria nabsnona]|nr:hypothetical protein EDD85DRAFT_958100 [Armillaria nabsnona]
MSMVILLPASLCSDRYILGLASRRTILDSAQNLAPKASTSEEFGGTVKCSPMLPPSLGRVNTPRVRKMRMNIPSRVFHHPLTTPAPTLIAVENDENVLPSTTNKYAMAIILLGKTRTLHLRELNRHHVIVGRGAGWLEGSASRYRRHEKLSGRVQAGNDGQALNVVLVRRRRGGSRRQEDREDEVSSIRREDLGCKDSESRQSLIRLVSTLCRRPRTVLLTLTVSLDCDDDHSMAHPDAAIDVHI